jgi:DNA-directed RNA polymerase specialized sigma24 family protein
VRLVTLAPVTTSFRTGPSGTNVDEMSRRPAFVTTHWSVVLSAKNRSSPQSHEALEKLCQAYWYPLYAYARWRGYAAQDAEDLTQEFFARLLQKHYLDVVDRGRGRFRTFLLVAFKRFLSDEWDRARTRKRGGELLCMPFDTDLAEHFYQNEPTPHLPADKMYEKRWALALIEQTMARLRIEFGTAGKGEEFERLKGFLAVPKIEVPYSAVAAKYRLSEGALRVAVHRLRKRFRQIFREEIAYTVAIAEDADEELRHLLAVLSE